MNTLQVLMNELSKGYVFVLVIGNVMYFLEYGYFPLDQVLKDIRYHLHSVNIA